MANPYILSNDIFKSSELMAMKLKERKSAGLPFDALKPGYSFYVKITDMSEAAFRSMVSATSTRHRRAYKCIKHKERDVFEVTVVSDVEIESKLEMYESSAKAKNLVRMGKQGRKIYHFDLLEEGYSFSYSIEGNSETALRTACSLWSKKLGVRFNLFRHDELGIFEVARLRPAQLTHDQPIPSSARALAYRGRYDIPEPKPKPEIKFEYKSGPSPMLVPPVPEPKIEPEPPPVVIKPEPAPKPMPAVEFWSDK